MSCLTGEEDGIENRTMKDIEITEGLKGVVIYAESMDSKHDDWIILVSHVTPFEGCQDSFKIHRYVSYNLKNRYSYADTKTGWWGTSNDNYRFYKATEEQKKTIIDVLRKNRLKYISVLNKVIKI